MPYELRREWRRKAVLLEDLEARDAIEVVCASCRHWSYVGPHALLARFHGTVPVAKALSTVRCSACNGTEITWTVVRARAPRHARSY